ncbi:hypothetical protein GCM10028861_02820 [Flavobacterium koreense]
MFQFVPVLLLAQAGTLDTSFGTNGKSLICFNSNIVPNSSLLLPDDKVLIGGMKYSEIGFLARINFDGSLDTTFANNGIKELTYGGWIYSIDKQADGKIIIVGNIPTFAGDQNIIVSRIDSDGNYDTSFGNNGIAIIDLGTQHDFAYAVKVQADGKILVGGSTGSVNGGFSIIRLDTNGNLDPTFGVGGKVMTVFSSGNQSEIRCVEIDVNNKILVGGTRVNGTQNIALARYNNDGSLDNTFGIGGKVETIISNGVSDNFRKLKILEDGKILLLGYTSLNGPVNQSGLTMIRYLSNGNLDSSFGSNGIYSYLGYGCADLAIQIDGKIVVGSSFVDNGGSNINFLTFRFNDDGSLDTSFNSNGMLVTNINSTNEASITSVQIQSDNKIVCSGFSPNEDYSLGCAAIIRINAGTLSTDTFETNTMKLFPNPTTGIVNMDNSIYNYKNVIVYNYLGQEISKYELNALNNEVINLSSLSNGVYLLKFVKDSESIVVKLVKE